VPVASERKSKQGTSFQNVNIKAGTKSEILSTKSHSSNKKKMQKQPNFNSNNAAFGNEKKNQRSDKGPARPLSPNDSSDCGSFESATEGENQSSDEDEISILEQSIEISNVPVEFSKEHLIMIFEDKRHTGVANASVDKLDSDINNSKTVITYTEQRGMMI